MKKLTKIILENPGREVRFFLEGGDTNEIFSVSDVPDEAVDVWISGIVEINGASVPYSVAKKVVDDDILKDLKISEECICISIDVAQVKSKTW